MDIATIWSTLQTTMRCMESGQGDWDNHLETAQAAILLLMEYPTPDIVEQVKRSGLPTRGVLRWLAHEAGQMGMVDQDKLKSLAASLG